MNHPTDRRTFLTLAGAGVAGATLVAAAPAAQAATPAAPVAAAPALPARDMQNLVVHVKDARAGVLTVMVAGRDVEVVDHDLTARLVHAATTALQA